MLPKTARKLIYDTSDNLESVELTSSTRRALAENENDAAAIEGRRLDFDDCTSCEVAYHAMCYGARDVCDLVDYGSPFSATAAASIDTMCETFGSACDNTSPEEACQDQCPEGLWFQQNEFPQSDVNNGMSNHGLSRPILDLRRLA